MKKFLERTAENIYSLYGGDLRDICVILPNRRGGLFLKRYLAAEAGRTIWAPDIFSVEDFFSRISGIRLIPPTEQLFELFEIHKNINKEDPGTFEDFLSWGPQLLHDFGETDSYLADPGELFSYLTEARAISLWNPDGTPLTDFEKKYLSFYNSLLVYYSGFRQKLTNSGAAYTGMLFRDVAENIETLSFNIPWKKVIIAGMNAMTKAEEVVYDHLYKTGKAEFLWDCDSFYFEPAYHEAGEFLRKWNRKWNTKGFNWVSHDFKETEKNISITGVPDNIGQVKYCGELLSGLLNSGINPEEIAVVLPDEQLLMPLLNSLPPNVTDLNLTMGLPLKHTPLFSFFDLVFRLHLNAERLGNSGNDDQRFYFRDIISILQHPYIIRLKAGAGGKMFSSEELAAMVRKGNRVFYRREELFGEHIGLFSGELDFLESIFLRWKGVNEAISCLKTIIENIRTGLVASEKDSVARQTDLEYLFSFSLILNQVEGLIGSFKSFDDTKTFVKLFLQIAESTKLPFYGEPLKGVQVMGMLETRNLDFRHVIILSVNEGVLPSGKSNNSFIPFEIKRQFGLPTYQYNNSIYAYHFFRLLQHPSSVQLMFNMTGDAMGGGEKSRFINQIIRELPNLNSRIDIKEAILSGSASGYEAAVPLVVAKEKDVVAKLLEKAVTGFSPTSLNSYRRCPVQFYFREIAGISKPQEPGENLDSITMGVVVHEVLKDLFMPLKNKTISTAELEPLYVKLEPALAKAFKNIFPAFNVAAGRNLIFYNIARILVRNLIRWEMSRASGKNDYKIMFLEDQFIRKINIKAGTETVEVKMKGRVDRIEQNDDGWIVIDYKTGKFRPKELKVTDLEDLKDNPDLDKSFQLLTYSWLFYQQISDHDITVSGGIVSLKNMSDELPLVSVCTNGSEKKKLDREVMNDFGRVLEEILTEVFDVTIPFVQTEDENICRNCDYINFCSR